MRCPKCQEPLARTRHPGDVQWACVHCGGRLAGRSALDLRLDAEASASFMLARRSGVIAGRRCPSCRHSLLRMPLELRETRFHVEECERCRLLWFDRGEFEQLPLEGSAAPNLGPPVVAFGERIALSIGLPLLPDEEFLRAPACVTVALGATFVIAAPLAALLHELREWLLAPTVAPWRELLDAPSLLLPPSLFEGLLCLWFLLVFGGALERRIGSLRFGALLLAANGVGRGWQAALQPAGSVVAPGLAAAGSGILAALAFIAPWERLLLQPFGVGRWRWFAKLPVELALYVGQRSVGFFASIFDELFYGSFDGWREERFDRDERAREPWQLSALFALPIAWALQFVLMLLDDFGWPELAERPPAPWLHLGGALVGLLFGLGWRFVESHRSRS